MLLAEHLFDPGNLVGLLGPLFLLAAVAVAGWAYARVNIAHAQETAITSWKENAAAAEVKADRLAEELSTQRALKHEALTELTAERLKTDQTIVLEELSQFHKEFAMRGEIFNEILKELAEQRQSGMSEIVGELRTMEDRLVSVIGQQTTALGLIAEKITLGSDLLTSE